MLSHPRGALNSLLLLLLSSHLLLFQSHHTTADTLNLILIKANCSGEYYTNSSTFATNFAALLTSLTSKSSSSNSATANATAGPATDHAYGLFMCQGDLASSNCSACINTTAAAINQSCPASRQAIIWYDYCQLRYSDLNFFGVPDTAGFSMTNPNEKTSSNMPLAVVADLVANAPFQRPLMFASNASVADSLYALAQCTADLSTDGCSKCLTTILTDIKTCCTERKGWRYLAASCWVRYEDTPFLNLHGAYTEIIRNECSGHRFPPNSLGVMESNLNNLLLNLASKAQPSGFYNTTVGESPDQLYGLALCRGDLATSSDNCSKCLSNAGRTVAGDCPNMTEGIKWYEKCLMRYSNQNFFGMVDFAGQTLCGVDQVSQAADDATVNLAMRLVGTAANDPLMVAAGEEAVSSSYVLVQCTRDLSSKGCKNCLEIGMSVVSSKCKQTNGWRYLSGSCTLRYEVFPFFNTSAMSSPRPSVPHPTAPPKEEEARGKERSSKAKVVVIVAHVLGAILLGLLLGFLYYLWWRLRRRNDRGRAPCDDPTSLTSTDLPLMDLAIIQAATCNFSYANKLGEGGFGPVYKGMIHGGKEIAVKRLSTKSKQGATEFKNEVKLIAKLQHRNLVKMLGYCVEREEKLLIYEYLPNKSLDAFLFDPNKRAQLDWSRRVRIIAGIARGLLYLHEDSLLKVIHRDLKASNVLLDNEMNPKISDFGMAKIFEADESEANTSRVVGTYGYMAPEYAMDGLFSVKSDVYSFGVLLLEIVSGEKNGSSYFEKYDQSLIRNAWQLWNEDKAMEMMDSLLGDSYPENEAMNCIHIGLLCIQENAEERPTMSSVVHMLQGEQKIPQPTQPPTFIRKKTSTSDLSSIISRTRSTIADSINEITESVVEPR